MSDTALDLAGVQRLLDKQPDGEVKILKVVVEDLLAAAEERDRLRENLDSALEVRGGAVTQLEAECARLRERVAALEERLERRKPKEATLPAPEWDF